MPQFKYWRHTLKRIIARKDLPDHTLKPEQLPPGSRLMDAEDFMRGPIDAMPDELLRMKNEKIIFDHPWPFNAHLDIVKGQPPIREYNIGVRFFAPFEDGQVLTNTLLESEKLEAQPLVEPTEQQLEVAKRHYDWSTRSDSVLVRLPRKREFPKINLRPDLKFGLPKDRQEVNVLSSLQSLSQTILANHIYQQGETSRLDELLDRRSLAFPRCVAPFQRQNNKMSLDLCVDYLSLGSHPLPLLNPNPESTRGRELVNIHPRSWKSLIEQTHNYVPDWSFSLPRDIHLHTILLASRIKRAHRDENEMTVRSMIHSFGLASQFVRLRAFESHVSRVSEESDQASAVLLDPLNVPGVNDKDLLERPIVLQAIGLDLDMGQFHFMRYQLNTLNFNDTDKNRIKNQAWYSGPVCDLRDVLRFYVDFQAFGSLADRQMESAKRIRHIETVGQQQGTAGIVT